MTISTTERKKIHLWDNIVDEFSYPYIQKENTLSVSLYDAEGTLIQLIDPSKYSLSAIDAEGICTITDEDTLAIEAFKVVLLRTVPFTQELDLGERDFPPEEVEDAFDKSRLLDQQVNEELNRGVQSNILDESGTPILLPVPATGEFPVWTAEGNFENSDTTVGQIAIDVDAAAASAAAALVSETNAAASETQTGLDAVATGLDRVQTGLDATATAADRVQTGLDVTATNADVVTTNADVVQTGLDAVDTAADRVQTGLDVIDTAADAVQTGLDAAATAADVILTNADVVSSAASAAAALVSETNAAASAATIPTISGGDAGNYIRVNTGEDAYEQRTPAEVVSDLGVISSPISASGLFTGSTGAIVQSTGVTSVVRNSIGKYTVTLSSAQADANYVVLANAEQVDFGGTNYSMTIDNTSPKTTTVFDLICQSSAGANVDPTAKGHFIVVNN